MVPNDGNLQIPEFIHNLAVFCYSFNHDVLNSFLNLCHCAASWGKKLDDNSLLKAIQCKGTVYRK